MPSVNKVILVGNVGKDINYGQFDGGGGYCSFSIATNESWKDKNTGQKKEHTEWHKVTAYGKLANIILQYVKSGDPIYIEGKHKTRKYQDKSGNDRYITEVIASQMQMLGSRSSGEPKQVKQPDTPSMDFDDEIPF